MMDEHENQWFALCRQAWVENDPVKLLETTMKISQFLARKQQRLDAEAYEREYKKTLN